MSSKEITEQERQDWLDAVHFSSSCNLPIEDEKQNKTTSDKPKQDNPKT
jgi:hypothetical protein